MEADLLQLLLGVAIFAILFSIGIGLAINDFMEIVARPRAFAVALSCQLLLLPAMAIVIAGVFDLRSTAEFGLLLLAVCPGGVTSNMFTRIAGGFTALSVSLTACNSMLAAISIPVGLFVGQRLLGMQAEIYTIPLGYLAGQLLIITFVPVLLGMLVKRFAPRAAVKLERYLVPLTSVLFFVLIFSVWYLEYDAYRQAFLSSGLPTIVLFVTACALSLLIARAMGLARRERIAMMFEVGVQNPPVAFFIAASVIDDMTLMPPAAVYAVVMVVASAIMVPFIRRFAAFP